MRYGISVHGGVHPPGGIIIRAKRNNWRPTSAEPEMPPCLEYLAADRLVKVGDTYLVLHTHARYPILASILRGERPDLLAVGGEAKRVADLMAVQIETSHKRLWRRGFDMPPGMVANHVYLAIKERYKEGK